MTIYPIDFRESYSFAGHDFKYTRLNELCQGGPEVGHVVIDNVEIPKLRFGGPPVLFGTLVFLPNYDKGGFRVASIDLNTRKTKVYTKHYPLVLIRSVDSAHIEPERTVGMGLRRIFASR